MPATAAAGYQWTLDASTSPVLELPAPPELAVISKVAPTPFRPGGEGVGSAGVQRWTVTARIAGRAMLALTYSRPWEGESSALDRFRVTIDVS